MNDACLCNELIFLTNSFRCSAFCFCPFYHFVQLKFTLSNQKIETITKPAPVSSIWLDSAFIFFNKDPSLSFNSLYWHSIHICCYDWNWKITAVTFYDNFSSLLSAIHGHVIVAMIYISITQWFFLSRSYGWFVSRASSYFVSVLVYEYFCWRRKFFYLNFPEL